jgi:predicted nucleic acid-binding protein
MIAVDSSVLAYLYLPGPHSAAVKALLERDPEWVAPPLWRSEFGNILAGYLRREDLNFEQTCAIQAEVEDLLAGAELDVSSRVVLELVRGSDCSAYDCEFVAVARQLGIRLATMDRRLLRAFPDVARRPEAC